MAAGVFTIQEIPGDGSPGERFEWTSDRTPVAGARGGARACPLAPLNVGGKLANVRTDYPGARVPSVQVMGPRLKSTTLSGRFDDRYNFDGYAVAEMRRLEAMCERGNPVRVQYLSIVREGLIIDWDFEYRREWFIGYRIELDAHNNPNRPGTMDRSPDAPDAPVALFDAVDTAVQAMLAAHTTAPRALLGGTLIDDVGADLQSTADNRQALGATIDNTELGLATRPTDVFTRLATQFRQVRAGAYNALVRLAAVRSDVELATRTAMSVLDFEEWSRSLRFMARIAIGKAHAGDLAATERATPDAMRLYRPQKGESLYSISRKFYGTPYAWRLIYERNALTSITLAGTETLIIPERGGS